jgi:uncharacterized coiled-coil protein SlyX
MQLLSRAADRSRLSDPNEPLLTMQPPDLATRVTELEILLTHFQRELGDLNALIREQQRTIDSMKRQLAQFIESPPQHNAALDLPSSPFEVDGSLAPQSDE